MAQGFLACGQPGPTVVAFDLLCQFLVPCFLTEILPVRFNSIKTLVGPGDHRGQHLALGARKAG